MTPIQIWLLVNLTLTFVAVLVLVTRPTTSQRTFYIGLALVTIQLALFGSAMITNQGATS